MLNKTKTRKENLAMVWFDYKKTYDMALQSWILLYRKMYKIPDDVIQFIQKTMKTWRMELTAGVKSLARANILRTITICNSIDVTQSHTQKLHGRILTQYIARKDQALYVHGRHQVVC